MSKTGGTSGWGPAPAASSNSGGGWGTAPPPNPTASAAWGNANDDNGQQQQPKPQQQQPQHVQQPPTATAPGPANSGSNAAAPASQSTTSTSWAAAAGKGLPTTEANANGSSTASKQLEQLNSVREALFSQDGWGGCNVKQDTSWDIDGSGANGRATNGDAQPKETNMWNSQQRNDGTDLWKSNLSGQPAAPKPQPSNPWGHTPQNPTDYKNWGEDEEGAAGGGPSNDNSMWRSEQMGPNNMSKSFANFGQVFCIL